MDLRVDVTGFSEVTGNLSLFGGTADGVTDLGGVK